MSRSTLAKLAVSVVAIVTAFTAQPCVAELQNVQVGGSVRIRGDWYTGAAGADNWTARNPLFEIPWTNSYRGIGGNPLAGLRWPAEPGRLAVGSIFGWNADDGHTNAFVEERTRLNVKADFTDQVSAFVELDSFDIWGEDFRSNYLTGQDLRAVTGNDVEVYQSYIDANEMFGQPLRLRIGRQELKLGSGWLVGANGFAPLFTGLSFDGVRATYAASQFSVDAFWAKLNEVGPQEEDGDTDFYGIYASYLGIENVSIDAYWLLLRDALSRADTPLAPGLAGLVQSRWEKLWNADDYDVTTLNTIGLRGAGKFGPVDFEAEVAYQFGNASAVGRTFAGAGLVSPYGDSGADFSAWGANLQVGYTFDTVWTPRVYVGGAYFGGEDNRDSNFWQWLAGSFCPFYHESASVSFNRLFSEYEYSSFLDASDLSNLWLANFGVSANPTEKIKLTLAGLYMQSLDGYETLPSFSFLGTRVVPGWVQDYPWWYARKNAKDLGWEFTLSAAYQYSQDLSFEVGYAHLFLGDGLKEGNFNQAYGLGFNGGTGDDDPDYLYFETKIQF